MPLSQGAELILGEVPGGGRNGGGRGREQAESSVPDVPAGTGVVLEGYSGRGGTANGFKQFYEK